jgi:hypothetical protein
MVEPTSDEQKAVFGLLPRALAKLPPPVRFRGENALNGFAKAKTLLSIDREMASFRAITAVEEAASALIRSLQLRGYPRSDVIDLKRHSHKIAVPFFLAAVQQTLYDQGRLTIVIKLFVDPPKLTVALPIRQFVELPQHLSDLHLEFVDPLGMQGSTPGIDLDRYFDAAVTKIAKSRKVDKLIAEAANARNRILYAHDTGTPTSGVTLESISIREGQGRLCLLLAIAVLQVDHHQNFALQCLEGYLKVIGRTGQD